MTRRFSPAIEQAIEKAAAEYGVPASRLRAFVGIESGGDPRQRTGSYKGALQLSDSEFSKYGGGDIYNPTDNIRAGALKLKAEETQFRNKFGRDPTDGDLYLTHQQGWGGAQAHWANPEQAAWKSMASTGEGRQKGDGWSRKAIWGNVPDDVKGQYGSVDNITSGDFANLWNAKVSRWGGNQNVESDSMYGPKLPWNGSGYQMASAPISPIHQTDWGKGPATPAFATTVADASGGPAKEMLPWGMGDGLSTSQNLTPLDNAKFALNSPMGKSAAKGLGAFGADMAKQEQQQADAGFKAVASMQQSGDQANAAALGQSEASSLAALQAVIARRQRRGAFA